MDSKISLRKTFIQARHAVKSAYREQAMLAATKHFLTLPFLKENTSIACYIATETEFDTKAIIEAIWKCKCRCYLPVMNQDKKCLYIIIKT